MEVTVQDLVPILAVSLFVKYYMKISLTDKGLRSSVVRSGPSLCRFRCGIISPGFFSYRDFPALSSFVKLFLIGFSGPVVEFLAWPQLYPSVFSLPHFLCFHGPIGFLRSCRFRLCICCCSIFSASTCDIFCLVAWL